MDQDNDIDNIIDQLKYDSVPSQKKIEKTTPNLNDQNVGEYVYNKTAEVIEIGLAAANDLKDSVVSGQDPKEISALAQLIAATTKAIDHLNKINLQAKQHKNNLEVANIEASSNKLGLGNIGSQTNNIVIATRDEILKIQDKEPRKKIELIEGNVQE
jgi:hypothetical protein